MVRFDKVATLEKTVITGKLGDAAPAWLVAHRVIFYGVFGFDTP